MRNIIEYPVTIPEMIETLNRISSDMLKRDIADVAIGNMDAYVLSLVSEIFQTLSNTRNIKEISMGGLKKRGWTDKLIKDELGKPNRWLNPGFAEERLNDYARSGSVANFTYARWDMDRVMNIEAQAHVAAKLVSRKLARK